MSGCFGAGQRGRTNTIHESTPTARVANLPPGFLRWCSLDGQLQPLASSLRSGRRLIADWLGDKRKRRQFYPFSTSDSSGYRSHMKSTKARTFGVGRRLDVWRIHKATSEPEIVPH